jgi:hypothetical protein
MTIEPLYKCTRCGELWRDYELQGDCCGDVTCGGSVVEVAQPLDGAGEQNRKPLEWLRPCGHSYDETVMNIETGETYCGACRNT